MYTLLVIDMQPYFTSSSVVLGEVLKLIKKAKKDKATVIVVEYDPHAIGESYTKIKNTKGKYKKFYFIDKNYDDGSFTINDFIKSNDIPVTADIRLCGVNLSCCVKKTALGLRFLMPRKNISVIRNACNDSKLENFALAESELMRNGVKLLTT